MTIMKSVTPINQHRPTKLLLKLSTMLLISLSHTTGASGFFSGAGLYYITSNVDTKFTDNNNPKLTEKKHYAVSGFAQGLNIGYSYALKDKYHIGASLEYLLIDAEQQATNDNTTGETRDFLLTLHHAFYPTLTFGFSPSQNTSLILKAGYGSENWSSDMNDTVGNARVLKLSKHDERGRIVGAEMLTMVRDKVLFGFSAMHSSIDRFNTSDADAGGKCILCHAPETLSVAAKIQYQPNGFMEHSASVDQ
jgi:hypothetical protein